MAKSLKELRSEKGFSQAKLAKACGLSKSAIERYEQGSLDINKATLSTIKILMKTLDCKITDLVDLELE